MFKVLYYYYYLFYTKIIPDYQPNATVIFTLGFTESLFVDSIFNILYVHFYCQTVDKWVGIGIAIVIIFLNYLFFYRNEAYLTILHEKPKIWNNKVSVIFCASFCIICVFGFILSSIYVKSVLTNCR